MNPLQNVLKMSIMSLADTNRETATPLTDGCHNDRMMVQLLIRSTNSHCFCFCFCLQDVMIMSQVKVLHKLRWKCNCSCVYSGIMKFHQS